MKYPKVIYQDTVNDLEFRIIARIEKNELMFAYEVSSQKNQMDRPTWKNTKFFDLMAPPAVMDYSRMQNILTAILDAEEEFDRYREIQILDDDEE